MADPFFSIIIRSFNEAWALRETLPAVQAQEYRNWELIVIDSGSTDGSVDLIRKAGPRHFIQILHEDYNPSRVLNLGMELAGADFAVFLNADATPQGTNWLRPLVQALQDPRTAAVFGRQIPRPDCEAVYAHDYGRCFGPDRESQRWDHFFSMASSGLRKDIWAQRGFLEKMQYSEDDEYTRWCRAQGYQIVYVPESVAMHSHNYTPQQAYKRSFGEARALAAVWPGKAGDVNWPRTVLLGWLNDTRRDLAFCLHHHRLREWPHALRIRWHQRRARLTGFRDGWSYYRNGGHPDDAASPSVQVPARARFTVDGDDALEAHLADVCEDVLAGVQSIVPQKKLDALVLGGGYGRGQGGVLKTFAGDRPYNDLEFYVFLRGHRLSNDRRYRTALHELGERLAPAAGLPVEFKIESLARLRRSPTTMFSYDLVSGNRLISSKFQVPGSSEVFAGCEHHRDAAQIPLHEATRLLWNRCTGLLLVKELLLKPRLTADDEDFIERNLAKAQLAMGDVVLTVFGQYHWDCTERHKRLVAPVAADLSSVVPIGSGRRMDVRRRMATSSAADPPPPHLGGYDEMPWLDEVRKQHARGVEFKLHPQRLSNSRPAIRRTMLKTSDLAQQVWLWLEGRRLNEPLASVRDYALHPAGKCSDTSPSRNVLLNVRTFGPRGAFDPMASRYPRERLLNSLPLLLWDEPLNDLKVKRYLQQQLRTEAADWPGFVAAYKKLWPDFR